MGEFSSQHSVLMPLWLIIMGVRVQNILKTCVYVNVLLYLLDKCCYLKY